MDCSFSIIYKQEFQTLVYGRIRELRQYFIKSYVHLKLISNKVWNT